MDNTSIDEKDHYPCHVTIKQEIDETNLYPHPMTIKTELNDAENSICKLL